MNYQSIAKNFMKENGGFVCGAEGREHCYKELLSHIAKGSPVNLDDKSKKWYMYFITNKKIFLTTKKKYDIENSDSQNMIYIAGPDTQFNVHIAGRLMEEFVGKFGDENCFQIYERRKSERRML